MLLADRIFQDEPNGVRRILDEVSR